MVSSIPAEVRRLIAACIPTVPHLEALVLAHGHPAEAWSAAGLSDRLYVPALTAQRLLDDLVDAGLLVSPDGGATATYAAQGEKALTVDQLVELYARHVVAVSRLIHAGDADAVQRLADAFRFPRRR